MTTPGPALQKFLDALAERGCSTKDCGSYYMAQCPTHLDNNPSLSITTRRSNDGFVLNCFAGCDYRDVLLSVNFTESDLYDDKAVRDALGPVQTYAYAGGRTNYRYIGKGGKKTFRQEGSKDDSLYGIERLSEGIVYFCEGEKAVEFLRALGYQAVATGGAQRSCDLTPLKGREVVVIADRDSAGYTWALKNMQKLAPITTSVKVVQSKYPADKADVVEHINAGYSIDELEFVAEPTTINMNGQAATNGQAPDPDDDGPAMNILESLEGDFWSARPELELIFTAALSRMASPWAVFACCVARVLSLVPPTITLPALIGDVGSLNWFAAIAAKSGGGKGAAMSVARRLVPGEINIRGIGSGEGMIECYNRAKKADDDDDPTIAILFSIDEIDSLGAMGGRSGQTTMSILRSGFSGESLGYSYRGRQSETVAAHTYRMTLVAAVQPQRAGILLNDSGGGTPQRFMWFPGRDRRITADVPEWPLDALDEYQRLRLISSQDLARAVGVVEVPDEVIAEIRQARAASMSGDDNALDGHALFCREKLAFALAYLDGRTDIDKEDWRLAGIAATVSDWMRAKAAEGYQAGREEEARDRGSLKGVELASADLGKDSEKADRFGRVLRWTLNKIDEAGVDGVTTRELTQKMASRDRRLLSSALSTLTGDGLVRVLEGTTTWVRI